MCIMCLMMTEMYTTEGGQKYVSSLEGTTHKKNKNKKSFDLHIIISSIVESCITLNH